jgi:hypothetical protein
MQRATASSARFRNVGTALALTGFATGMYLWTTQRMKATDVLADLGSELDQVRKLKKEAGVDAGATKGR